MPDSDGDKNDGRLFRKISRTSDAVLSAGARKSYGYTKEELKRLDATDDYSLRKAWKDIKKLAIYFLAVAVVVVLIIFALVIGRYVYLQWNDADGLSDIITGVYGYLFGIASTVVVQIMLDRKKSSISDS